MTDIEIEGKHWTTMNKLVSVYDGLYDLLTKVRYRFSFATSPVSFYLLGN